MARDHDPLSQSDTHNARGIELADRGWHEEAVKEFQKALTLDPNSAHAYDNLATVYADQGRFRDALDAYLTALKLEPESATAHYNLACFLSVHGRDFAVTEYQEAIALDPAYSDAHLNLGLTWLEDDRLEEATRELTIAMELDPADPAPRHELAGVRMDGGDYRGAIALLNEVVRLEPANDEAWHDLGICYAQKGFYEEAARAYEAARALRADDVLLVYNQAALHALWGKRALAITLLREAVTLDRARVVGWLGDDPMFDALKGEPDFEQVL